MSNVLGDAFVLGRSVPIDVNDTLYLDWRVKRHLAPPHVT
jgi:hypothetical protein